MCSEKDKGTSCLIIPYLCLRLCLGVLVNNALVDIPEDKGTTILLCTYQQVFKAVQTSPLQTDAPQSKPIHAVRNRNSHHRHERLQGATTDPIQSFRRAGPLPRTPITNLQLRPRERQSLRLRRSISSLLGVASREYLVEVGGGSASLWRGRV